MTFQPSRQRFRPGIETCESRALAAAGLGSLTAHENPPTTVHSQALTNYAFLAIGNPAPSRTIAFKIEIVGGGDDRWTRNESIQPGETFTYDRSYRGAFAPQFLVTYDRTVGKPESKVTVGLLPKLGSYNAPPSRDFILRYGFTYHFRISNGQVSI